MKSIYALRRRPWHSSLRTFLAAVMAILPSLQTSAQTPTAPAATQSAGPAPTTASSAIDTTYVTPTAIAMAVVRPAQLLKSQFAEVLPTEVATAAGLKYLGFDPADVEELRVFVDQIVPGMPPKYAAILKFSQPTRAANFFPQLRAQTQSVEVAGKTYLRNQDPVAPSIWKADERTIILASDALIRDYITTPNPPNSGALIEHVRQVPSGSDAYVFVEATGLRPLLQLPLIQAKSKMPPQFHQFLEAPNLITGAELTINLSKAGPSGLVLHCNDDAAAQRLETLTLDGLKLYREQMTKDLPQQPTSPDPVDRAFAHYMERVSGRWTEPLMPQRAGSQLKFFYVENRDPAKAQLTNIAVMGILVALLLPAVQAAREAARRNQSLNNMKQLILALLNYESAKGMFPPQAIYSADGKPLLSWRVAILPYLEHKALYNRFHLDEPWDSEHNRPLVDLMPVVFQNPSQPLPPGKTTYLAVVGEKCLFDGTANGLSLRDITGGTAHTIAIVEANTELATDWTKPDDWSFNEKDPKAGLGRAHPGGNTVVFADGHTEFISTTIDPETLKRMFTRDAD